MFVEYESQSAHSCRRTSAAVVRDHELTLRDGAPPQRNAATEWHHVVVLLYDGVQSLDVTGPVEALAVANALGARYRVFQASTTGRDVVTLSGVRFGVDGPVDVVPERVDTLIVPGASHWQTSVFDAELVAAIGALDLRSERTVSIGSGAFLLAESGRLDGRRVSTHWDLTHDLSRRFPFVHVDESALFVTDGKYVSSAGVAAAIDMTLALIEDDHTAHLAGEVARRLVVFMARPGRQAQLSVRLQTRPPTNASLRAVLDAIIADPAGDHSVPALAARAGVSPRHLGRMFTSEVGLTPMRYVDRVRLEAACAMLMQGRTPMDRVAQRCGIGSTESLRRLFRRELGLTPSDYRHGPRPAAATASFHTKGRS